VSIDWLQIIGDHHCNQRCFGCFAQSEDGPSLTTDTILRAMQDGFTDGAYGFWLSGGEPMVRKDFFHILDGARGLGFERVRVQTNGMWLADEGVARRFQAAGVTDVTLALRAPNATLNDKMNGVPGSFEKLEQATQNLSALGLNVEGEIIVYRQNVEHLEEIMRHFHGLGIQRFTLSVLSVAEMSSEKAESVGKNIPRMSIIGETIDKIIKANISEDAHFIQAPHLPPCVVKPEHYWVLTRGASMRMRIVEPDGKVRRYDQLPLHGGGFLTWCDECSSKPICDGIRGDYVRAHGFSEFNVVKGPETRVIPLRK